MIKQQKQLYIAAVFSIALHAAFLLSFGGALTSKAAAENISKTTEISFLTFDPEPAPSERVSEEKKPETKRKKENLKTSNQALFKKEIVKTETEQEVDKPDEKKHVKQVSKTTSLASSSANKPHFHDGLIQKETDLYLSKLMAHIERHKWYPKAARRRGIEGDVSVSFILLPDGSIKALMMNNNSNILTKAVRQAVEDASPMPKPPASINCPLPCKFQMRFSLNVS